MMLGAMLLACFACGLFGWLLRQWADEARLAELERAKAKAVVDQERIDEIERRATELAKLVDQIERALDRHGVDRWPTSTADAVEALLAEQVEHALEEQRVLVDAAAELLMASADDDELAQRRARHKLKSISAIAGRLP